MDPVTLPAAFVYGLLATGIVSVIGLGGAVISLRYGKKDKAECNAEQHECRDKLHERLDRIVAAQALQGQDIAVTKAAVVRIERGLNGTLGGEP